MILVRARGPERSHDSVAYELLDCPTGPLDLGGHRVVEAVEHSPSPLRVLLAEFSRPDEVREEDRGDLALL